MTDAIRVALADDQELIRLGFRMVLDAEDGVEVVAEAGDGAEALDVVAAHHPDVVLMDIRMPGLDGIEATARITREHPGTHVLVLTTFDLDEYAFGALAAGASGFLLKDAQRAELLAAIRAVHRGDAALAPSVTRRLIEHVGRPPAGSAGADEALLGSLTEREREVFVGIARGEQNAEIAESMFLSESTVKTHVGRVLQKLGARDRVQAVILAARWGLIPPD